MEPAAKILITGGVSAIVFALLEGVELSRRRTSQPAAALRPWFTAHETGLMQGAMMLGLSLAVPLSKLGTGVESLAAWLILVAMISSTIANLSNALQNVTDQFAARSLGLRLNQFQAVLLLPGVIILLVGVARGL